MLTEREIEELGQPGFFIRDSFFGAALARQVLAEARKCSLDRAGVSRAHALADDVRTDEMTWLCAESTQGAMAKAVAHFHSLMRALNETAWLGLRRFDLQLARYQPGARYVRHRDAFVGQENRRVTAIAYLNLDWVPAHGGQLRLYGANPIDVAPVLDRLVVFRSELVEHEVLVAAAERWALTAWYSALEC